MLRQGRLSAQDRRRVRVSRRPHNQTQDRPSPKRARRIKNACATPRAGVGSIATSSLLLATSRLPAWRSPMKQDGELFGNEGCARESAKCLSADDTNKEVVYSKLCDSWHKPRNINICSTARLASAPNPSRRTRPMGNSRIELDCGFPLTALLTRQA